MKINERVEIWVSWLIYIYIERERERERERWREMERDGDESQDGTWWSSSSLDFCLAERLGLQATSPGLGTRELQISSLPVYGSKDSFFVAFGPTDDCQTIALLFCSMALRAHVFLGLLGPKTTLCRALGLS